MLGLLDTQGCEEPSRWLDGVVVGQNELHSNEDEHLLRESKGLLNDTGDHTDNRRRCNATAYASRRGLNRPKLLRSGENSTKAAKPNPKP